MSSNANSVNLPDQNKAAVAVLAPLGLSALLLLFGGNNVNTLGRTAMSLAALAIVSIAIGMRWYGPKGLGMRGGRPLFAGIGFSFLGWLAFLICRFFLVEFINWPEGGALAQFFYLIVFEAFCLQLWAFGFAFKAVADWRGPLSAAFISGILFGVVAYFLFQESYVGTINAAIFFAVWGVFYGIIRLRTGSFIGIAIVQSLQSLTAWFILQPPTLPNVRSLGWLYMAATICFFIFIWRLWPQEEGDYRV